MELSTQLATRTCTPCRGGIPPLDPSAVETLVAQTPGWTAIDDDTKLQGEFRFKNFRVALDFVTEIGELAEAQFHHPLSIHFGWGFATLVLQTKKIKGLHENDFIMAAKISATAGRLGASGEPQGTRRGA